MLLIAVSSVEEAAFALFFLVYHLLQNASCGKLWSDTFSISPQLGPGLMEQHFTLMETRTADLLEMKPEEDQVDRQKRRLSGLWRRPPLATGSASSLLVELDLLEINCCAPDRLQPGVRGSLRQSRPRRVARWHPAGQGAAEYRRGWRAGE